MVTLKNVICAHMETLPKQRYAVLVDHSNWQLPTPEAMQVANELNRAVGSYFPEVFYAFVINKKLRGIFDHVLAEQRKGSGIHHAIFESAELAAGWLKGLDFPIGGAPYLSIDSEDVVPL